MLHKYFYSEKSESVYFDFFPAIKKTNTAIVFIHGLTGSRNSWGEELKKLQLTGAPYNKTSF